MSIPNWKLTQVLFSSCEEPAPVSGEILDPPFFASSLFPPFAFLLPLQLRGSSCQPLADTQQRTQILYQTLQIHQKRFSSFYLPLRRPTDGVPASLFHRLPSHLKNTRCTMATARTSIGCINVIAKREIKDV